MEGHGNQQGNEASRSQGYSRKSMEKTGKSAEFQWASDSSKLRKNQRNSGKVRETRGQRGALEYKRESRIVVVVLCYSS